MKFNDFAKNDIGKYLNVDFNIFAESKVNNKTHGTIYIILRLWTI